MSGAIVVSEGSTRDLGDVMTVMEQAFDPAFGEAWNAGQCVGVLGLPGTWLLVARIESVAVGFALLRRVLDEAELLLVAVDPAHRGLGVARALLARAFTDSIRAGVLRVHLEMREGNPAARLYDRAGFREIGRRRGYYRGKDGQIFDAQTLSRDLSLPI